jgi:conjugative transfer signal peptidase TraF
MLADAGAEKGRERRHQGTWGHGGACRRTPGDLRSPAAVFPRPGFPGPCRRASAHKERPSDGSDREKATRHDYIGLEKLNLTRCLLTATLAAFAATALAGLLGARVNTTGSYPKGLYWMTSEAAHKGALVIACPPDVEAVAVGFRRGYIGAGFCHGGYGYVIKKIVGLPDDQVTITGQGVSVNGEAIPNSAPRQADTAGNPLPLRVATYTLGTAQVLLMSDYSPKSFDGRYFGPIEQTGIKGVLRPVLTLGPFAKGRG